jgi:hypothetical protein
MLLAGCSGDDIAPDNQVVDAFMAKYPTASQVTWETEANYLVADFLYQNVEASAWFDGAGNWYQTEFDIPYSQLPEAVKVTFESGEYADWRIDDIDMLERSSLEAIYIIEVEQGSKEVDLYFSADGVLLKVVTEGSGGGRHQPDALQQSSAAHTIESWIAEKYPNARIVEIDSERGGIEVDIIHDGIGKEVYLDAQYQWLRTEWEIRVSALPTAVATAISTAYAGYRIDDAEYVETPAGNYYLIEIEQGEREQHVRVDAEGNILS